MALVFEFPPVAVLAREWTVEQPISRSLGASGAAYTSAHQRERRVVSLSVAGLDSRYTSGGYVEMFKRYLEGGLHLARLRSWGGHWSHALDPVDGLRGQRDLQWTENDLNLPWTDGDGDLVWVTGATISATSVTDGIHPAILATGLPPGRLICVPNEICRVGTDQARVAREAYSDDQGRALIRLNRALPSGAVEIGAVETAVFRHQGALPRAMQPVGQNWSYDFNFIEVFLDETPSGFTERNPWR